MTRIMTEKFLICSAAIAHCDRENIASYKTMEKLGMVRTGEWGGRRNKSASQDSYEYQYELIISR